VVNGAVSRVLDGGLNRVANTSTSRSANGPGHFA
jgi:hypothetical protein